MNVGFPGKQRTALYEASISKVVNLLKTSKSKEKIAILLTWWDG